MSFSQKIKSISTTQSRYERRTGVAGELVLNAVVPLFRVSGGPILVTGCYGKVTTAFAIAATTVQLQITPVGGVAQNLSAASGNLSAVAINTTLAPTGALAVAITVEVTYGATFGLALTNQWLLIPGVITEIVAGATNLTGVLNWTIIYTPLSRAANVVAL